MDYSHDLQLIHLASVFRSEMEATNATTVRTCILCTKVDIEGQGRRVVFRRQNKNNTEERRGRGDVNILLSIKVNTCGTCADGVYFRGEQEEGGGG